FFTDTFVQILQESHAQKKPSLELEKHHLGITHAQIGAMLLEHWKFPQSIVRAVGYHHNPIAVDSNKDLVATIRLADVMCELWGIGFDEDIQAVDLYSDAGWKTLKSFTPKLIGLDVERFLFEVDKEIEKAKMFIEFVNE
ncbi:MAG: HDOD domain-containing protein, partial [Calditrichaeota bacterium]